VRCSSHTDTEKSKTCDTESESLTEKLTANEKTAEKLVKKLIEKFTEKLFEKFSESFIEKLTARPNSTTPIDPNLATILTTWQTLPDPIKTAIAIIAKTTPTAPTTSPPAAD